MSQVGPLAGGVALALLIRALVIETFYVPSESMLPTLLVGDHVFVNKFAYGARVPIAGWRLPPTRDPERGDVVVFDLAKRPDGRICPLDECRGSAESFVKRIVGVPGDTLELHRGVLHLNGEPVPTEFSDEEFVEKRGYRVGRARLDGAEHGVLDDPRDGMVGLPLGRVTVPEGRYFMLGDNRDHSNDSRRWGTVARGDLRGPVVRIYWSWNNRGSWLSMLNPLTWIRLLAGETRWSRIGEKVP